MTSLRSSMIGLAASMAVASARPAVADPADEARSHLEKATAAFKDHRFDDALTELTAAYAIEPRPDMLFAIGQVYVKLDRCPDAIASYQKFLDTHPDEQAAAATRQAISACQKHAPAAAETTPTPPAGDTTTASHDAETETPPSSAPPSQSPPAVAISMSNEARPWYGDRIGGVLVAGGVVAGVAGVLLYRSALGDLDAADASTSIDQYHDQVDSAHSKRLYAVAIGAAGVAMLGVGAYRVWRGLKRADARQISALPVAGGGLIVWSGSY